MKHTLLPTLLTLLGCATLMADDMTWPLADGGSIQGSFRGAMPGVILLTGQDGRDQRVPVSKLSAESKARIAALIGLTVAESAAASPAMPAAAAPAPAAKAPPVATSSRDPGAMDATDVNLIASRLGMKSVVSGVVKSVVTLGASGHKKLLLQDTEFEVFLPKQVLEQGAVPDLEALAGRTVQVTGTISKYMEKPQISLRAVSDLAVVE